ncbi:hypothetical protein HDU97_008976 [Phlyctochytrium planicorne]|nr:hypothetical protein HDU97_008976 [Phlyctochytrium planicorne]
MDFPNVSSSQSNSKLADLPDYMTMETSPSTHKLAETAETLLQATLVQAEMVNMQFQSQTCPMRHSFENQLPESIRDQPTVESKWEQLNQSIANLRTQVSDFNAHLVFQTKQQRLDWALSNSGVAGFSYYEKETGLGDFSGFSRWGGVSVAGRQYAPEDG